MQSRTKIASVAKAASPGKKRVKFNSRLACPCRQRVGQQNVLLIAHLFFVLCPVTPKDHHAKAQQNAEPTFLASECMCFPLPTSRPGAFPASLVLLTTMLV